MKKQDLIGKRFGQLTVEKQVAPDRWNHVRWQYVCDCGGTKVSKTSDLNAGRVKSCGCINHLMGEKSRNWRGGKVEVRCANPVCGKTVLKHPSKVKMYNISYCSNECRFEHRPATIIGTDNPRFKEKIVVACAHCGNSLSIWPCHDAVYKSHFCKGTGCFSSWKAENVKGKANPNYHGGTPEMRKIRCRVSAAMRKAIRQEKGGRTWESLVEYSMTDLINRLKATIPQGYLWERDFIGGKGVLHIDHMKPMSSFSFATAEDDDFKRCFAIDNLQLLPAIENMKKSAKLKYETANP